MPVRGGGASRCRPSPWPFTPGPGDDDTAPLGDVRNNYNMVLKGYFYPPKDGNIQLAIATDDPGQLYFSPDENPANKKLVATESQWNPVRSFGGGDPTAPNRRTIITTGNPPLPRPENWSEYIRVTKGKPYYIEGVGTEFGVRCSAPLSNGAVKWQSRPGSVWSLDIFQTSDHAFRAQMSSLR